MRILVTNDDGIDSPGLHALAQAALILSDDVVVVAPDSDWSGSGAALGPIHLTRRVTYRQHEIPGVRSAVAFAVDGPPALGVLSACLGGFGPPPDLVLSGVNPGLNAGRAVVHSGTVGAVLTALNHGIPGVAASLEGRPTATGGDRAERWWETAALLAAWAGAVLLRSSEPYVANLNVPNRPLAELAGVRRATAVGGFGNVRVAFVPAGDCVLEMELQGDAPPVVESFSEQGLVDDGYVALTVLHGIAAAPLPTGSGIVAILDERVGRTGALV